MVLILYMKALILFVFIFLVSCGPGWKDGSRHLVGEYYFTHSGGDQRYIERIVNFRSEIVIPARIEDFLVLGENIYISRIPIHYKVNKNIVEAVKGKSCEYWMIQSNDNKLIGPYSMGEAKLRSEWQPLINFIEGDGVLDEATFCPLIAMKK